MEHLARGQRLPDTGVPSGVGTATVLILDGSELRRRRLSRLCMATGLSLRLMECRSALELGQMIEDSRSFDIALIGETRDPEWLGALQLMRAAPAHVHTPALMIWPESDEGARMTAMSFGVSRYFSQTDLTAADLHDAISHALSEAAVARLGEAIGPRADTFEPRFGGHLLLARLRAKGMLRRLGQTEGRVDPAAIPPPDTDQAGKPSP